MLVKYPGDHSNTCTSPAHAGAALTGVTLIQGQRTLRKRGPGSSGSARARVTCVAAVQKAQLWAVDFPGMGVRTPGAEGMLVLPCGGAEERGWSEKRPELQRSRCALSHICTQAPTPTVCPLGT